MSSTGGSRMYLIVRDFFSKVLNEVKTPMFNTRANSIIKNNSRKILLSIILFLLLIMGVSNECAAQWGGEIMESKLLVNPEKVLIGDSINIQVKGVSEGQIITLTISGHDQFGNLWLSKASFKPDQSGVIDTARHAPFTGYYEGIDQTGLFWSMTCNNPCDIVSPFAIMPKLIVSLLVNGEKKEERIIERIAYLDIERYDVTEPIVGVFYKPHELSAPSPALIVLGGSEGGYNAGWASIIASKTRLPTLALAYFGSKGLPKTLENIPLETIEMAIAWLNGQPFVKKDSIGIVGASRGGELAILAASLFPQIKLVVGYTPSGVIWEGIGNEHMPAWTFRGKPFPYLKFMMNEEQRKSFIDTKRKQGTFFNAPIFEYSLQKQESRIEEATIPAEKSKAAFLLIGNPDDGVWPSHRLSQLIIKRLKMKNYPRPFNLLSYSEGGHMLIPYPYYPTTLRKFYLPTVGVWEGLGGSAKGAARAAEDSWAKVIDFIRTELK